VFTLASPQSGLGSCVNGWDHADRHVDPRGILKCPMKHLDVVDAKLDSTLGARPRLRISSRLGEEASAPTQAARAPWHIPYVQGTTSGAGHVACARIALRVQ
jgi:hypothetical protein